jgi:phosphinothricin acetyltransferase
MEIVVLSLHSVYNSSLTNRKFGDVQMKNTVIRNALITDAKRILEIYSYYVENTAITFEYFVPTLDEFQRRMKNTMKKYPYLVIEIDGIIKGYAYAGAFVGRAAYDWSCEVTVYLDRKAQKCGFGRMLYEALEKRLCDMGILNLYACIGYPNVEDDYLNKNSADFHTHLGFSKVGEFNKCGYKFGRWYNMIWMEKIIGTHQKCQLPVRFSDTLRADKTTHD